jgi:hypothetical protein
LWLGGVRKIATMHHFGAGVSNGHSGHGGNELLLRKIPLAQIGLLRRSLAAFDCPGYREPP